MSYLYVVICVLLIFYIAYYYRYPDTITILQTSLANFYFDMLREKQPIVVQDKVVDVNTLVDKWFKLNFVHPFDLQTSDISSPTWIRNKYKYTLLHVHDDPCEVLIASARDTPKDNVLPEEATIVALRLSPHQSVIIPFRMHYAITHADKKVVKCYGIDDFITKVLP